MRACVAILIVMTLAGCALHRARKRALISQYEWCAAHPEAGCVLGRGYSVARPSDVDAGRR